MKKEIVVREKTLVKGEVSITLIVRISVTGLDIKGARSFYADKQPVYIIISSGDGNRAYSVTGEEVAIQQVILECPALAVGLEG